MCSRKLLMHIAVDKGAPENKPFREYVDFLVERGHVPTDWKEWVDHIREKGNQANHEIVIMERGEAEDLVTFLGMILAPLYEFPAKVRKGVEPASE